ncbi:hypothetical protein ETAA8_70280 [Anatilimnocola aggregata]|uniref:Uncharacterized protein n=1 Tax=Anatilimnocola aggregata TaxID=2528021 RepID=A0A517YNR7_9BACT|nr:hypothetical protein ETAA8_70280 [Anatilimnocola aggregata]
MVRIVGQHLTYLSGLARFGVQQFTHCWTPPVYSLASLTSKATIGGNGYSRRFLKSISVDFTSAARDNQQPPIGPPQHPHRDVFKLAEKS